MLVFRLRKLIYRVEHAIGSRFCFSPDRRYRFLKFEHYRWYGSKCFFLSLNITGGMGFSSLNITGGMHILSLNILGGTGFLSFT